MQGGIHNQAFLYGSTSLIPASSKGSTYSGVVHITDWMPTLMNLASNGNWTGPRSGLPIDGVDVFTAIVSGTASPRTNTIHNYNPLSGQGAVQIGLVKYIIGAIFPPTSIPLVAYSLNASSLVCNNADVPPSSTPSRV